ncbi:MAG TPA: Mrp/NBP35 family ATP-binding protein [Bryobacteraceae bacterium]|nr:Mrp/NBP35 family ATP-binding protein [Bryobacteraceae bacterium]HPT25018.1 Mrp/NBP35 family ATP-binding protein [Bryobacteraceae bacterium]
MSTAHPPETPKQPIEGVNSLIAIGSGKGGVGKTTVSVNLAIALAAMGYRVGLLDADVYGPNVPLMMGVSDTPYMVDGRIQPIEQHGVKLMSMGFLNPGDKPLIWRGPMLHSVMQQFLRQVEWGDLDYLLVDLPPGTGDVQLSLIQTAPISGAVVVTTPSEVALEDGRKAVLMFRQVKVELLGMVENMSYLIVPGTSQRVDVFGEGGGKRTAEAMDVPFLGELPMEPAIRIGGDTGRPAALQGPDGEQAKPFFEMARRLVERAKTAQKTAPRFTVED